MRGPTGSPRRRPSVLSSLVGLHVLFCEPPAGVPQFTIWNLGDVTRTTCAWSRDLGIGAAFLRPRALAGWSRAPGSDRGALLARRLGSLGRQLRHPADRGVPHFLRGSLVREMLEAAGAGGLGVWFRPDGPTRSSAPVLLVLLVVHAAWAFGVRRAEAASSFASWSTWARSASGSFSMSRVRTLMV